MKEFDISIICEVKGSYKVMANNFEEAVAKALSYTNAPTNGKLVDYSMYLDESAAKKRV